MAKASYAAGELGGVTGTTLSFSGPHFNEFVIKTPGDAEGLLAALREEKIIGGLNLERFYPELKNHLLVCVTETVSKASIDRMTAVYEHVTARSNGRDGKENLVDAIHELPAGSR